MTAGGRLVPFLLLAAGCASVGGPPDTAGDVGGAVGGAATGVLRHVPVVNTLLEGADDLRGRLGEWRAARVDAARAAALERRLWAFCAAHPCTAACASLHAEEFALLGVACPAARRLAETGRPTLDDPEGDRNGPDYRVDDSVNPDPGAEPAAGESVDDEGGAGGPGWLSREALRGAVDERCRGARDLVACALGVLGLEEGS